MQKLICYKLEEKDPSVDFLKMAKAPLMDFWWLCEGTPGWSALVKSYNRIIGGQFFAGDAERAAQALDRLCMAAESKMKSGAYDQAQVRAIRNAIKDARLAGAHIQQMFRELSDSCQVIEDVTVARFVARQGRN